MTENTILKDGKLQLETLAEVIRDKQVELSEQGLVLVATLSASGCAFDADELHPNDDQGIAIRMLGAALPQLIGDAMTQEPESLLLPGYTREVVKGRAVFTHDDCKLVKVAGLADMPYRTAGTVSLLTLDSFERLVKERIELEGSADMVIYVNDARVAAIFNRDGWQDDKAEFNMHRTQEWQAWTQRDGKWMTQETFCDFLEDQESVIVEPCGVDLLRLVADFRQNTRVSYGSSYRGSDGQISLTYCEEKSGANKEMALPAEFKLHLPVVKGAEELTTYCVKARLRVRVDKESHALCLQYQLVKPNVPVDNAVADMAGHLREQLPDVPVYEGAITRSVAEVLGG